MPDVPLRCAPYFTAVFVLRVIDHFIKVLGLVAEASCPPRPMGPPKLRYHCVLSLSWARTEALFPKLLQHLQRYRRRQAPYARLNAGDSGSLSAVSYTASSVRRLPLAAALVVAPM